jgi:hypothetical protein
MRQPESKMAKSKRGERNVNGHVEPGGRTTLQLTEDELARVKRGEAREWMHVCVQFDAEMAALKRSEAEEKIAKLREAKEQRAASLVEQQQTIKAVA